MLNNIENMTDLAQAVVTARKAQSLSQEDLAGLTGTGRRVISDIENGKPTAQVGKLLLILNTLGISLTVNQAWR